MKGISQSSCSRPSTEAGSSERIRPGRIGPISGNHWCVSVFVLPLEAECGWTRSQINLGYSIGMISGSRSGD